VAATPDPAPSPTASWLRPRSEQQGLRRYLAILAERRWLVIGCVLLTTAAAVAYVVTVSKVYKARAQLLVTPVGGDNTDLLGLGLIPSSNDPTRDVSTAAELVTTGDVARRVIATLHLRESSRTLLEKVTAEPVAQSNVVQITAEAHSAAGAARLANAFANATIADRTIRLHRQLDLIIPRLQTEVDKLPVASRSGPGTLGERITTLQTLRQANDPTVHLETTADPPGSPSSPRPKLSIAAGILAGLILGVASAFGLQALDPRVRRETQLRELFSLPFLARVPKERPGGGPLDPDGLSPAALEAYRTLRGTLAAAGTDASGHMSLLITGSSPSEGKTTTAINVATSLAQSGKRVILIEADLRRPSIGQAVGLRPPYGIGGVLIGEVALADALVTSDALGPNLQMLLVEHAGTYLADRLSLPSARQILAEARAMADYVVVDSPPLTEVIDALPLAREVDAVVVIARLGVSRINKLQELGEQLAQQRITPAGIVVVGVDRPSKSSYYVPDTRRPRGERRPLEGSGAPR
jgi:capsular exopolysaccharide synthesis family protein